MRSDTARPVRGAWDLHSADNEIGVHHAWAVAIVHGETGPLPSRPDQDDSIAGYSGVEELNQRYGEWVIDAHLPAEGSATQPIQAGYMANAYVRMRHSDYDALRTMLDAVGSTLHVYAS